mgnify:CR=1 FL=1
MGISVNITKAGVVPYMYEDGILKMMFMLPSSPKRYGYQVAKGSIEKNERLAKAAMREATEELGLREDNIITVNHPGIVYSNMIIFPVLVKDKNRFDSPTDKETKNVKWMTINEFHEIGHPGHLPIIYGIAYNSF